MAREKGTKNLKRVEGGYLNEHGVYFSEAEKRALESAVNSASRKRRRLLAREANLPYMVKGKETGKILAEVKSIGGESDFILAKKTKSLQRFKSKREYHNYMENLARVNERGYIDSRAETYRQNYITGLRRAFGSEADEIIAKIESMSLKEYMELVEKHDDSLEIGYLYLSSDYYGKLNEIRLCVGLSGIEVPEDGPTLDLKRRTARGRKRR